MLEPVWLLFDYVGLEVQRPRRIGAAISPQ
jgi:hypothetical protein